MGSKSSSKSSSKSLLPKGLNLMHVVLAVVLGLLICSMLSMGNVEGLGNAYADTEGACVGKYSANQNLICSEAQHAKPTANAANNADKCGGSNDKTGGACKWKGTNEIYSYSGGLEGSIYDEWMRAAGLLSKPSPGKLAHWIGAQGADSFKKDGADVYHVSSIDHKVPVTVENTTLIPLSIPGRNTAGAKAGTLCAVDGSGKATNCQDAKYAPQNFLKYIGVTGSKDVQKGLIPEALKDEVETLVKDCESGWKKNSELYRANGNKPIMGYNVTDGLVCRNPFYQPITRRGTEPRVHFASEGGCPTPDGKDCDKFKSGCAWKSVGGASAAASTVYNNMPFTNSGPCGLPACAGEYPAQCAKANSINAIWDLGGNVSHAITSFGTKADVSSVA
jgi:hypothetical protein